MKKQVRDLKVGDKIELLNGSIVIVSKIGVNEYQYKASIHYENGMKTYALPDEEVEILQ
jgi:hypothetical protein